MCLRKFPARFNTYNRNTIYIFIYSNTLNHYIILYYNISVHTYDDDDDDDDNNNHTK